MLFTIAQAHKRDQSKYPLYYYYGIAGSPLMRGLKKYNLDIQNCHSSLLSQVSAADGWSINLKWDSTSIISFIIFYSFTSS